MMRYDIENTKEPEEPEFIASESTASSNLPSSTWHLPLYRPSSFVERASLQIELANKLKPSWTKNTEEAGVVACCGLGGTGKTSLARDYIHRPYGNPTYTLRAWFSGEYLENDYVEFAVFLGLIAPDEKIDRALVIQQVKEWLETNPGWLLVYDNAHFLDYLEPFLPTKGGNILITSRNPTWPSVIEVNSMRPEEAEAMVYQLNGHKDADTPALVKELGYLPLAIAQASAYMKENGKTAGQYLTLYQTEHKKLLLDGTLPPGEQHQHWPVAVTWQMNLQSAAALSSKTKDVLECMAYVHAEGIPYSWLQRIIFEKLNAETEIELDKILKVLRSYSLIQHSSEEKTISLHRLIQTITRQKLNPEQQVKNLIKVIEALDEHYDFDNKKITENRQLIPHLLASLAQVEALSPSPVELIPVSAALLDKLGVAYSDKGDYHQAKTFLERALTIKETHYGPHHPKTGMTLRNLSNAYGNLGDYEKKKELLLRALKINETHYGKEHPQTGFTLTSLGTAYGALGNYEKQKELLLRALKITETHYGKEHPSTGITLTNLGNAYGALGDHKKKKELLLRALQITETHYGKEHPETGITLNNLGNAYGNLGDYEKQKDLLLRALTINETHYGKEHPKTGATLTNLGNAYGDLGDYEKQKDLLLRALTITETHYGKDHPNTGITLDNLGNAYGDLGDYEKQKDLLLRALTINETHYGKEHPQTGITLHNLGNAWNHLGNYQKGKDLLIHALTIYEKHYNKENPYIAENLTDQGYALNNLGDYKKAKEFLLQALEINEKHYGKDHSETGKTLTYLGVACASLNDTQTAYTYQKRAYDILFKFYGAENQYTKYAFLQLQDLKAPQSPLVFSKSAKASNNNNEAKSSTSTSQPKPKKSECTIA